jgi:hypothetical protein
MVQRLAKNRKKCHLEKGKIENGSFPEKEDTEKV